LEIQRFVNKVGPHGAWNQDPDFLYGLYEEFNTLNTFGKKKEIGGRL
jgi:hypothetical protein